VLAGAEAIPLVRHIRQVDAEGAKHDGKVALSALQGKHLRHKVF